MSTTTRLPRTQLLVVFAAVILVAELFANEMIGGDDPSAGGWISLSAFGIAVMVVLVLVVVPRVSAESRRSWTLGPCVVFWSALPFAFAAATLAASKPGEEQPGEGGEAPASAGVLLALLATVVAFVLCIIG